MRLARQAGIGRGMKQGIKLILVTRRRDHGPLSLSMRRDGCRDHTKTCSTQRSIVMRTSDWVRLPFDVIAVTKAS